MTSIKTAWIIGAILLLAMNVSYGEQGSDLSRGTPKVALLTSLDPDSNRPWYRGQDWNVEESLVKRFQARFHHPEYAVVTKTHIRVEDLVQTLSDPDLIGLFIVTHVGAEFEGGSAEGEIKIPPRLADYQMADMKDALQLVGPHLRFIGLVGCKSNDVIEEIRPYTLTKNGLLQWLGFDRDVDAFSALDSAVEASSKALSEGTEAHTSEIESSLETPEEIEVQRTTSKNPAPPVFIKVRGQVLGFMRALSPGESQKQVLLLDAYNYHLALTSRLQVETGWLEKDEAKLGDFEIRDQANHQWIPIRGLNGNILGHNQYLFSLLHQE